MPVPVSPPGVRTRVTAVWRSRVARVGALVVLLALSGAVILALVREQTGTQGFLVGLALAVTPVPLLVAAFRWLERVEPSRSWRNLLFAFAWGACAAALVAIIANSFATHWIAVATADPAGADLWGATVIAPVVEESGKAVAVLLLFLFRRRDFTGVVYGVAAAGVTATGFAFTENILYLGNAFGEDQLSGLGGFESVTAATFFVRIVMSPFAHPLFTVLTGLGFGFAVLTPLRHRVRRVLLPAAGLLLAMGMHAAWNGSAMFGQWGFLGTYALLMVPAFGLLTWLAVHLRGRELRIVREELAVYATAGWLTPPEPALLGSMRARGLAYGWAFRAHGAEGRTAVREYVSCATQLAILRRRTRRRALAVGPEFTARERELLEALWRRREPARAALAHAARATAPARPAPLPYVPAQSGPAYGYGYPAAPPPGQQKAAYPYGPQQVPYGYAARDPYRA
ncbi:PrsW family intramembrane metalloprotease [Streptomyces sp. NPDC060194]|uniref:PrsW family intramembrane metalloprotease n=1 Tax=Streptomyces sp. NPDC060194 TaxID=3347069 RepID=UPI003668E7E3